MQHKKNEYGNLELLGAPFLSFTANSHHACYYAYGLKQYNGTKRIPSYINETENKLLGVIQVGLLRIDDLNSLGVCNVNAEIAKVNCRIKNEEEISLDGILPKENFVFQCEARMPDLKDEVVDVEDSKMKDCEILGISNITKKHVLDDSRKMENFVKQDVIRYEGIQPKKGDTNSNKKVSVHISYAIAELAESIGCKIVTIDKLKQQNQLQ